MPAAVLVFVFDDVVVAFVATVVHVVSIVVAVDYVIVTIVVVVIFDAAVVVVVVVVVPPVVDVAVSVHVVAVVSDIVQSVRRYCRDGRYFLVHYFDFLLFPVFVQLAPRRSKFQKYAYQCPRLVCYSF